MKLALCFLVCMNSLVALGQDVSDVMRLKDLGYMKLADKVECKNTMGSTLEDRICLNLEFQKVDSIMNVKLTNFLTTVHNDTIRNTINTYQKSWIAHRRIKSKMISEGYRGHMLGIIYLGCMVETTMQRIKEINYLSGNELDIED